MNFDSLLAEMQRVFRATHEERDAAQWLQRLERRLTSGHAWEARDGELLATTLGSIERAYPESGAERERLANAMELAILEDRTAGAGVLCLLAPPRGWPRWIAAGVPHYEDPWDEHPEKMHGYVAVRRGWGDPELLFSARMPLWADTIRAVWVPETQRLFVAARDRVTVHDVDSPAAPLFVHELMLIGGMQREGDRMVVFDETDVEGYALDGSRAWSIFADPPYDARVEGDTLVIHEQLTTATRRHRLSDGSQL